MGLAIVHVTNLSFRFVDNTISIDLRHERYILDGALIANEVLHDVKVTKRKGFLFKVDFGKAFDSISWDFLMEIMKQMGFGQRWQKWIHACLSSASISILVNGSPTKEFSLQKRVRQGDPLSPYLFIMVAEGLNHLTKLAASHDRFSGISIGRV
ncbi:secreted RxLR effector protein 78-like [Rutidosis leptorrhynchoides]|uniref:secreted RxLR effector protein 78-like n=1 Tax=Rutidosis leptorrhynchoides TaxID=125765 RepID=UPI003A99404C